MSSTTQDKINKIADTIIDIEKFKEQGEFDNYVNNTPDDVVCPKCGFNGVYEISVQNRSADESGTLVRTCLKCHYKWRLT